MPYISNSDHIVYYDNYDVADYPGGRKRHRLVLGNGMQDCAGGEIWDFDKAACSSAKFPLCFETPGAVLEASDGFVNAPGPIFSTTCAAAAFTRAKGDCRLNLPGFDASG